MASLLFCLYCVYVVDFYFLGLFIYYLGLLVVFFFSFFFSFCFQRYCHQWGLCACHFPGQLLVVLRKKQNTFSWSKGIVRSWYSLAALSLVVCNSYYGIVNWLFFSRSSTGAATMKLCTRSLSMKIPNLILDRKWNCNLFNYFKITSISCF